MQHNFNSADGKTDEEIRAENAKKYLGEVRMSNDLRWHDKLSPKNRRKAFFAIGYFSALFTGVLYLIIKWIVK